MVNKNEYIKAQGKTRIRCTSDWM